LCGPAPEGDPGLHPQPDFFPELAIIMLPLSLLPLSLLPLSLEKGLLVKDVVPAANE